MAHVSGVREVRFPPTTPILESQQCNYFPHYSVLRAGAANE